MSSLLSCLPSRLVATPPHPGLAASVVVPVKNEAALLPRCLAALASQRGLPGHAYEVILLINNSSDDSAALASDFAERHPGLALHVACRDFPPEEAHIGSVRRLLMDEACARLESTTGALHLILSTDADTYASPDWLAQNLREIRHGAQAVGGAIELDPNERARLPRAVRQMQKADELYSSLAAWLEDRLDPLPHDPWPRHYHHFGASLAVTPALYRLSGGLPREQSLEDLSFYRALLRHDARFRHSRQVQVFTSARLEGRVQVGLSSQLRHWRDAGHPGTEASVDSAEYLVLLFEARHEVRALWHARQGSRSPRFDYALGRICRQYNVGRRPLSYALESPFFGEAWEKLDLGASLRSALGSRATQPLAAAIAELQRLEKKALKVEEKSFAWRANQADSIPA